MLKNVSGDPTSARMALLTGKENVLFGVGRVRNVSAVGDFCWGSGRGRF